MSESLFCRFEQCQAICFVPLMLSTGKKLGLLSAAFLPIHWVSKAIIHVLVITVESTAFTTKKAVYYTVGTRVSHALPCTACRRLLCLPVLSHYH